MMNFRELLKNKHDMIRSDNSTTVAYINHIGARSEISAI
jgi:hypothetical protein